MTYDTKDITLLLAPFQGITDKIYRNAFASNFGGVDKMYTPFVSGTGTSMIKPSKLKELLPVDENIISTIPQIISTNAKEILLFAQSMLNHGYDHINWNLGCPFSRLANKKRGCGILPFPDELKKLLDEFFPQLSIGFSIKTRLGYYKPDEIYKVIEVFNDYPLKTSYFTRVPEFKYTVERQIQRHSKIACRSQSTI